MQFKFKAEILGGHVHFTLFQSKSGNEGSWVNCGTLTLRKGPEVIGFAWINRIPLVWVNGSTYQEACKE